MQLADRIYSPKAKTFLRLCDGSLQGEPDPTNRSRPMHCGLGELYVAMTGMEPEVVGVDEVVELAYQLSPLATAVKEFVADFEATTKATKTSLKKLSIPIVFKKAFLDNADTILSDVYADKVAQLEDNAAEFREVLFEIPEANDDGNGDGRSCTIANYKERSRRVAEKLRAAASLLPA